MKHVLIVDDERHIRLALRMAFEDAGYQVEEAPNGQQGLTCILQSPFPLVVLLDVMMPVLDGFGVLTALFQQPALLQRHRILVHSAAQSTLPLPIAQEMTKYHIRFINKPFDVDVLEALVDALSQELPRK